VSGVLFGLTEPDNSHCQCGCALKRIGEDVSEKLDYTPGAFTVERHIRGSGAAMIVKR
jgi:transposase